MERLPANIPRFSSGVFDPFSRVFIFVGGFFMAWISSGSAGRAWYVTWYGILSFTMFIAVFWGIVGLHTEVDEEHIATVFRVGRFWRMEFESVRWSEVRTAEVKVHESSRVGRSTSLILTTQENKKFTFTTWLWGNSVETFYSIAREFHGKAQRFQDMKW